MWRRVSPGPGWNGKWGKEIPTSKCDIYGRGGALVWRSEGHLL